MTFPQNWDILKNKIICRESPFLYKDSFGDAGPITEKLSGEYLNRQKAARD